MRPLRTNGVFHNESPKDDVPVNESKHHNVFEVTCSSLTAVAVKVELKAGAATSKGKILLKGGDGDGRSAVLLSVCPYVTTPL